ncbi:MAG: acyl carrier protein [Deltaproteobacteria bacterium]|nr:acyl carrier protein [Deltaproteobacteria bacterium]
MHQVEEKIIDIISRKFHVAPDKIRPDLELRRDLKGSDLDLIELLVAIEKDCGVEIDSQRASRVRTVRDACQLAASA